MRSARDVMADLAASGLTVDQQVLVMELVAAATAEARPMEAPERTARQERNRRYYENRRLKASEERLTASEQDVSDVSPSLPPAFPPGPPQPPTLAPECVSSRTRGTGLAVAKPNGFARFWEAYPSKVGKPKAEAAYARAVKRIAGPDPPLDVMLRAIESQKLSRKWREGIIPNPATWLNQDRWADELPSDPSSHELSRQNESSSRADRRSVWSEVFARERASGAG